MIRRKWWMMVLTVLITVLRPVTYDLSAHEDRGPALCVSACVLDVCKLGGAR